MSVHPQVQAIVDAMKAAGVPPFSALQPAQARSILAAMEAQMPSAPIESDEQEFAATGPARQLRVRRFRPLHGPALGRVLYFHGGGWVVGTTKSSAPLCRALADASGFELLSVEYRLAPESPFPSAIDDGWAVLEKTAALGDGLPVFVGGDSAGANLAAALALRARDAGGPAIAGQILFYPVTDCDLTRESYRVHGDAGLILGRDDMAWFWGHYIADPAKRVHPWASPLRAEHHRGLPPAFIAVAGYDPLHDEGVAYAAALQADGTSVELRDDPDMVHGYCSFVGVVDVADASVAQAGRWARSRVHHDARETREGA